MSFNGSGTFLINTAGQPVVSGTVISSTAFNALTADLATGLSTAITKDGQTTVTANIPMSTYKFTGLGVGSAATDSANLSQVQSTVTKLLNSVSGADTITATASPTLAAYAAGQMFYFVAAGDNTTSVTLNIDALGAKAVTRDGSTALVAADIKSGEVIVVVYDGTRFQVVSQLNSAGDARFANVSIASSLYVGGVSTFVGNAGFSANVSIASALSVGGVAAITGATTIGGNLTLSGGTANGVAYLNASKVVTSGTALAFDGGANLSTGGSNAGTYNTLNVNNTSATGYSRLLFNIGSAGANGVGGIKYAPGIFFAIGTDSDASSTPMTFNLNGSEQMRLTSTGLGIGTASPGAKLDVATSSGDCIIRLGNGTSQARFAVDNDGPYIYPLTSGDLSLRVFTPAGGTAATIDSSGNLGLGVTPSAWSGVGSAFELKGNAYIASTSQVLALATNCFFDGSNWIYKSTSNASRYETVFGENRWFTAPSGTAGNAISFTQAMTLDASGNLRLGLTSAVYNTERLTVYKSGNVEAAAFTNEAGANNYTVAVSNRATTGDNKFMVFATESSDTTRGSIVYNRGTGLVTYATTSDYRAKDIIGPVQDPGATIDALKVYEGQMKGATQSRPMLVAHEAQEHAPYTVTGEKDAVNEDGTPNYQQMDVSALVPLLLAEVQSLRKRVAELESK